MDFEGSEVQGNVSNQIADAENPGDHGGAHASSSDDGEPLDHDFSPVGPGHGDGDMRGHGSGDPAADRQPYILAADDGDRCSTPRSCGSRVGYDFAPLYINGKAPQQGVLGGTGAALGAIGVALGKTELAVDEKLIGKAVENSLALTKVRHVVKMGGLITGGLGVALDSYNGFVRDQASGKMGAAFGTGALLTGLIVGGPVAIAFGIALGLASLYAGAVVTNP